jgi:DNA ligase-1
MKTLVDLFAQIKNEPATTKKLELLKSFPDRELLKNALVPIYDKRTNFGITSNFITLSRAGLNGDFPFHLYQEVQNVQGRNAKIAFLESKLNAFTKAVQKWFLLGLDKDLNIGIQIKNINKALGEEVVRDFSIQLASKLPKEDKKEFFDKAFQGLEWVYVNLKIDGIRCFCKVGEHPSDIHFYSRDGKEMEEFLVENIKKDIQSNFQYLRGKILDGEIFSKHFQKLMRIVNRKRVNMDSIMIRASCKFAIFDILDSEDDKTKLRERVANMQAIFHHISSNFLTMLRYIPTTNDFDLIQSIAKNVIEKGNEGLIVKHPFKPYEWKRSKSWIKFKDKLTEDLKVIGYFPGETNTKYENSLGGIILDFQGSELRCGSGFTDEDRETLWKDRESLIGKTVEISYMEATKTGSLRHPVFERFREDK